MRHGDSVIPCFRRQTKTNNQRQLILIAECRVQFNWWINWSQKLEKTSCRRIIPPACRAMDLQQIRRNDDADWVNHMPRNILTCVSTWVMIMIWIFVTSPFWHYIKSTGTTVSPSARNENAQNRSDAPAFTIGPNERLNSPAAANWSERRAIKTHSYLCMCSMRWSLTVPASAQ